MQPDVVGLLFASILAYAFCAFALGATSGALLRVAARKLGRGLVLDIEAPSVAHSGQDLSIEVSIRNYSLRKPKKPRRLVLVFESPSFNPPQALRALAQPSSGYQTSFAVNVPQVSDTTLLTTKVKLLASGGLVASRTRTISVVPNQQT